MTVEFMQELESVTNRKNARLIYNALTALFIASGNEVWLMDPEINSISNEQLTFLPRPYGARPTSQQRNLIPYSTLKLILQENGLKTLLSYQQDPFLKIRHFGRFRKLTDENIAAIKLAIINYQQSS